MLAARAARRRPRSARVLVIGTRRDALGQAPGGHGRRPGTEPRRVDAARLRRRRPCSTTSRPQAFTVSAVGWSTIASRREPGQARRRGPAEQGRAPRRTRTATRTSCRASSSSPRSCGTFSSTDWPTSACTSDGGPIFSDAIDLQHAEAAGDTPEAYDVADQADADAAVGSRRAPAMTPASSTSASWTRSPTRSARRPTPTRTRSPRRTRRVGEVLAAAKGWTADRDDRPRPTGPADRGCRSATVARAGSRSYLPSSSPPGPASCPTRVPRPRPGRRHPPDRARPASGSPEPADLDGVPFGALLGSSRPRANYVLSAGRARRRASGGQSTSAVRGWRSARAAALRRAP